MRESTQAAMLEDMGVYATLYAGFDDIHAVTSYRSREAFYGGCNTCALTVEVIDIEYVSTSGEVKTGTLELSMADFLYRIVEESVRIG